MSTRPTYRAGLFYPGDAQECARLLDACLAEAVRENEPPADPVAAIVPHAGWVYSGRVAAGALQALASRSPATELVVLFGAVHVPGVRRATVSPADEWATPTGALRVDREAAGLVLEALGDRVDEAERAHAGEHSLEVQVPFVARLFPDAAILPIATPPDLDAAEVGRDVARALAPRGDGVVFVGSTDLSHYGARFGFLDHGTGAGALRWVREENDARMLRLIEELRAEDVVAESWDRHNACGAGAVAATLAAARERGRTRAVRLGYTTSADVMGEVEPDAFVGYGGLVA
jgi:AmmeMemoRadiSam system protein B